MFSVLTTHFGDEFWIRELVSRLNRLGGGLIVDIVVVDQNRHLPSISVESEIPLRIVRFDKDERAFSLLGHDHPSVLQKALVSLTFDSEWLIVMDSDCLPVSEDWLGLVREAARPLCAGDPSKWGLTHPCFMVLPLSAAGLIDFREGLFTVGLDTGRLVGHQLASAGYSVHIERPKKANWGRGYFYFNGTVYHHGSASLNSLLGPRRWRASQVLEGLYRRKVSKGALDFNFIEGLLGVVLLLVAKASQLISRKAL